MIGARIVEKNIYLSRRVRQFDFRYNNRMLGQFFVQQLDFVFFIYGLSFMLMTATIYFVLALSDEKIPWKYLGFFSLFHGICEWLDMLAISNNDPKFLHGVRLSFIFISFVFLFEFGRQLSLQNGFRNKFFKTPVLHGLCLYGVIGIFFTWLGFGKETDTINALIRYFFAFPGALISAFFIHKLGHKRQRTELVSVAWSLGVYSFAAGVIAPQNPYLWGPWIHQTGFAELFSIPIQVLRALLAIVLSILIWTYYLKSRKNMYRLFSTEKIPVLVLIGICSLGFMLVQYFGKIGRDKEIETLNIQVQATEANFLARFQVANSLLPNLARALENVDFYKDHEILQKTLESYCDFQNQAICYLLDLKGNTLDSTNRNDVHSFVGKNYSTRKYFRTAIEGNTQDLIAFGLTSQELGYYTAHPVYRSKKIIAVVVIKLNLELSDRNNFNTELFTTQNDESEMIINEELGIVFAASNQTLQHRWLWSASVQAKGIVESEQLLDLKKLEIKTPLFKEKPDFFKTHELRIDSRYYRLKFSSAFEAGLRYGRLIPIRQHLIYRLFGIGISLLFVVLQIVFFILYRKRTELMWENIEARNELRLYQSNMQLILNTLPVVLWRTDEKGVFIQSDGAGLKVLGLKPHAVVGLSVFEFYKSSPVICDALSDALVHAKSTDFSVQIGDAHFQCSVSPIFNHGAKKVIGSMGVALDVTESRRKEMENQRIQGQLVHASKLASVGTLASGVAHEINNPLAIAKGFVDLFLEQAQDEINRGHRAPGGISRPSPVLVQSHQKIVAALIRIENIVRGLRTFARVDHELVEPLDLHRAIADTVDLIRVMFEKRNIQIDLALQHPTPLIIGNVGKIQQVIMNALTNARDAILECQSEGRVRISTEARTPQGKNQICMSISDNGCGIPEKVRDKLFEPFITTKEPGKGTGLGLALTHSIVASCGGKIEVQSQVGVGSTFIFTFPLSDQKIIEKKIETTTVTQIERQLLIVDDEADIREMIVYLLKKVGASCDEASNGLEALDRMKTKNYDLVITDIRMPKLSGFDLVQKVKKFYPNSKCIALTGGITSDYSATEQSILNQNIDGHLMKPFGEKALVELVAKVLGLTRP